MMVMMRGRRLLAALGVRILGIKNAAVIAAMIHVRRLCKGAVRRFQAVQDRLDGALDVLHAHEGADRDEHHGEPVPSEGA